MFNAKIRPKYEIKTWIVLKTWLQYSELVNPSFSVKLEDYLNSYIEHFFLNNELKLKDKIR